MKIILISNYKKDNQASMQLYSDMLMQLFTGLKFETVVWRPVAFFTFFFTNTNHGLAKWLGYLDKWIINMCYFSMKSLFVKSNHRIHICDHSNAPYRMALFHQNTSITCHDVLAIRGALGYKDAFCEASKFGVIYQKWILNQLIQFNNILCVSTNTLNQLMELSKKDKQPDGWKVIYNPINQPFSKIEIKEANARLFNKVNISEPFILHVGSNLPRKNKEGLIQAFSKLNKYSELKLVLAGAKGSEELKLFIKNHGCENRVINIVNPKFEELEALYSTCSVFAFPSFSEGFGWPIIEAQQCKAIVVTSNIEPMKEIGGDGVILCNPYDVDSIANALEKALQHNDIENNLKGYVNAQRFSLNNLKKEYELFFNTKL